MSRLSPRLFALLFPIASLVASAAQQAGAPAPTRALVPVAASSVAEHADRYYGQFVTLTGTVEQRLSPTAFSVDQDRTRHTGRVVLILAPRLNAPVDLDSYVTVIGEVVRFDPGELGRTHPNAVLDLPADIIAKFQGRPAVVATSVLNAAMTDLARRIPPPLTPDEEKYDALMKRVGPAFSALRQALAGPDATAAADQVRALKQAFVETHTFWKARGRTDAMGWASDAQKHAQAIERAIAAARWDDMKAEVATLGQTCQTCHTSYRERLDDGTYRIKSDAR